MPPAHASLLGVNTIQKSYVGAESTRRRPRCLKRVAAGRPNRVWLVDDDESVRAVLARLLNSNKDIECTREFSSPGALLASLTREIAPDTILLDVHLGDQNGIHFIQPIKMLAPASRVLVLTTFFDSECQSRALQAGASDFVTKHAGLDELVSRITSHRPSPDCACVG